MPVDFTNNKKVKTNYEYLQEILKGNDEGLEFLDAYKDEKEKEIEKLEDEVTSKEAAIDEKDTEITNLQEEELHGIIDTRLGAIGDIKWQANNIACQSMMEELDNAISRGVSLIKIENVLRAL
jgi:hypothetical protein